MSRITTAQRAIGYADGDTLVISNQWARVTITVHVDDSRLWPQGTSYVCSGDLADTRANKMQFCTMHAAVTYAMESLALYQEGRA